MYRFYNDVIFFCASVYTEISRHNASIFIYSFFAVVRMYLVGAFERSKLKMFTSFQKLLSTGRNKNKINEKRNLYAKSIFEKIGFGFDVCNSKLTLTYFIKKIQNTVPIV